MTPQVTETELGVDEGDVVLVRDPPNGEPRVKIVVRRGRALCLLSEAALER